MNAADIMTTQVVTIAPDATAKDAAEQMLASRISALPVVDASGKLLGIVSEGDLVRRAELGTARARSWWLELLTPNRTLATDYVKAHGQKVSELMTRDIVAAKPDTPIADIALMLEENAIKRVPIVDKGRLVGIVSRANLIQALAGKPAKQKAKKPRKDSEIRDDALAALADEPWRPWLVNITVHDGAANLWGVVNTEEERLAAGVAVENVPGVLAVHNHVIVRPRNWAEAKPYLVPDDGT
ncbi:CBS domain-containing protein [Methyloceanibacter sp.]|jgi:CBS domain-containing protein|uniref:CBS domain-containing protein n=1 Tax=Methyloceanibacter sp. TaxID=1965321 RepID=UPI002C9CA269|nr:CBS domain-containing protein [Methyloceanibacter sp.]